MKTTESTYEKQAADFLTKVNATMKTEFKKFDYHFTGDKHKRNIFQVTLERNGEKYSFDFGSSLSDSLLNSKDIIHDDAIDFYAGLKFESLKNPYLSYSEKIKVSEFKKHDKNSKALLNKKKATDIYNEFVRDNSNKHSRLNILSLSEWIDKLEGAIIRKAAEIKNKNFGKGIQAKEIIYPTAYDILTCLTKYDVGTFENFCGDFGYDTDSRSAERIYKSVCEEWKAVDRLFSDVIDELQEIQ